MQTKSTIGFLNKQYKNILLKCFMVGIIATSFAGNVNAATNPKGATINGMEATLIDPELNNYGVISGGLKIIHTNPQSGDTIVSYVGMLGTTTGSVNYTFNNFNEISIHNSVANTVVGMLADASVSGSHILDNTGIISVSGNDNVYAMNATVAGTGSHRLTNSGNIIANGSNNINGMFSEANGGNNILINNNSIKIGGAGTLAGINVVGDGNHSLTNNGDIFVNGYGAEIYGMKAKGSGNHKLINSNSITVIGGSSDGVFGMSAEGVGIHNLENASSINVNSNANKVHGVHLQSSLDTATNPHNITNSRNITVGGQESIYGIYGEVKSGTLNVENSGIITAYGSKMVYGIYVAQVQGGNATHNVINTGDINAFASNGIAYEVYGTTNYNVSIFATTLRNWTPNNAVFGVIDTQTLNFNNSTLIVRPGDVVQGFVYGKEYKVSDMIGLINQGSEAVSSTSTNVSGTIDKVVTELPFLTATLTNGKDPFNATIKIDSSITEETNPATNTMQQSVETLHTQLSNISAGLRKSLVEGLQATQGAMPSGDILMGRLQTFVNPYFSKTNNSRLNYDGSSYGVTGGFTYIEDSKTSYGGHIDFNQGNYDGDLMGMETTSNSFALGLHANYKIKPDWYVRGQLTGAISENDADYTINSFVTGNADYSGLSIYSAASTGYILPVKDKHFFIPEFGLSYLATRVDSYDIKWTNSGYNMDYDSSDYQALYANLNLDWRSELNIDNDAEVFLTAGGGLRQKLTSSDIKSKFNSFGTEFATQTTEDETTFLFDVGFEYKKDNYSLILEYNGAYGDDQEVNGINLLWKYNF